MQCDKPTNTGMDHPVFMTFNEFFQHYLAERDAQQTLAMLSDEVYSVGTGEDESVVGKQAFAQMLDEEITQLPTPILYTIADYVQKEKLPGCWDCFCNIDTTVTLPNGMKALYHMRVTAGLHWDGMRYLIDTIHASEASKYQEEGEFLPFKSMLSEANLLNRETQYQLMELVGQVMPGGIVGGYMEDGFPLYVANARFLNMAGYKDYQEFKDDIQGMVINTIHPDDREYVNAEMSRILDLGDQYEIKYRMKRKDGSYIWVYDIGRRTITANGRDAIVSVLIDVSKQVHDRACLEIQAISDPLTHIYNRKGGQSKIEQAIRNASSYFFFILDLDRFKWINDLYGHQEGDKVLCYVAEQLTKSFRKTDVVCRLGGDEFAVFAADCEDIGCIQCKVARLMESYREMMEKNWPRAQSTMSVGGVAGRKRRTFDELYGLADDLLYQVKNTQKGDFKMYKLD